MCGFGHWSLGEVAKESPTVLHYNRWGDRGWDKEGEVSWRGGERSGDFFRSLSL